MGELPLRPILLAAIAILAACVPSPPVDIGLVAVTPVPSLDVAHPAELCAEVDAGWNLDWPRVIHALEVLVADGIDCADGQPSTAKLYVAHYNHGRELAGAGNRTQAIAAYEAALAVNPAGTEAMAALRELGVFTPTPLLTCTAAEVEAARNALPAYAPSDVAEFVGVQEGRFVIGEEAYLVRGINYYPLRYPWRRFLDEANLEEVGFELTILQDTGFNTLRLFLWHDALFTCPGNGAVPVPEVFQRLDGVIQAAAERGFRLILTLNDIPDLLQYPLYSSPQHTQEQVAFIVERYRDEAAILAWDVRNEGDIDYQPVGELGGGFGREAVLTWLAETVTLVRDLDGRHLITAGWFRDEAATIPYVDFVSFHHWDDLQQLRERIASLQDQTDKPILLEEFGYSTYHFGESEQSRLLREAIQAAEYDVLAGWLIWTAFDYPLSVTCIPPACPSEDSAEHHFGLWNEDYTPKAVVNILRVLLNQP